MGNQIAEMGDCVLERDEAPAEPGDNAPEHPLQCKSLTAAAQRAAAEAEERRRVRDQKTGLERPAETGGRGGLDPVRYSDWEKGGLTSDF